MVDGDGWETMNQRRRKILFLTHRVPFPPDKGDKIRTFHQLDHLAVHHDVYCACFLDSPEDRLHAIALKRWCREVFTVEWNRRGGAIRAALGLFGREPLTLAAYDDSRMRAQLAAWSLEHSFDVVVAFSACMAPYALCVNARRRVLDLCDSDSAKWREYSRGAWFPLSAIYSVEGQRLRRFELTCVDRFDATVVISNREHAELDSGGKLSRLHVIGNGVDLPFAVPAKASEQGPVVSFVGDMGYRPNQAAVIWFTRDVWPAVRRRMIEAQFVIVGRNPPRNVIELGEVPGITVTGGVADVRKYLMRSRVVAAPLQIARGLPNKVLEAMAMQRPVVATSAVCECLDVERGRQLLVADDPGRFAAHVVRLLRSDELCDRVGQAGYRFVAAYHSWADMMRQYERLLLPEIRDMRSRAQELPDRLTPFKGFFKNGSQGPLLSSVTGVRGSRRKPASQFRQPQKML